MDNTIFVQIASYRDPQLIPTINNLLDNADSTFNLRVVVCWQHSDTDETETIFDNFQFPVAITTKTRASKSTPRTHIFKFENGAVVEFIDVDYTKAKGACWARNLIQQQYNGEKYTLQLDSHHRFVAGWDGKLISTIERLRETGHAKPVLTAYLPSFDPENDPQGRTNHPWKMNFDRFIPEGAVFFLPATIEEWKTLYGDPIPARFYSGHFTFADGSFAVEVQHDPEYFFHGEEISIAARAFTHGYDLFHPTELIAWHEYTRKNRIKVWDDHTTDFKRAGNIEQDWVERNDFCHRRNRILFGMDGEDQNQIDFGKYGFGTERSLLQYEEYAGISFKYRGVQQETLDKLNPPNSIRYENEEQWRSTFVKSNDIRVLIHTKNDLDPAINDYDFWYVGCHDENGKEIFRKDATSPDIRKYLKREWADFRLIFLSNSKPVTYTVWPHSVSKGWLEKIVKDVK